MLAPPRAIVQPVPGGDTADALLAMVRFNGSDGHAHLAKLGQIPSNGSREPIADALHYLCILHARQPSVIELASTIGDRNAPRQWLLTGMQAFAMERARLSQLAVAAGPVPPQRGGTNFEQLVRQQREALLTLVRSDRRGCLVGTVAALLLDWSAIHDALNGMARRIGLDPFQRSSDWPSEAMTLDIVASLGEDPAMSRALLFASQQLLAQHRSFWDLLDARHDARLR